MEGGDDLGGGLLDLVEGVGQRLGQRVEESHLIVGGAAIDRREIMPSPGSIASPPAPSRVRPLTAPGPSATRGGGGAPLAAGTRLQSVGAPW